MRTPLVRHLESDDLVRLLDQALEPEERTTFEAHLATCADCGQRSRLIQDWSGSLSSVLTNTDRAVALPDRVVVPGRMGWRAAAAILLILSTGLAVPQLRAWIIHTGSRIWTGIAHRSPATTAAPRVLARPEGGEFAIILPADTIAMLTIEVVFGDSLSVTQTTPRPLDSRSRLVMLPNAVQLGSGADYLVQVPLSVRRLLLRRGDSVIRTLRPLAVGDRWVVPLQAETAR